MIDGKWKHLQDRFWDRIAAPLARWGLTANQVTVLGTALMGLWCAAYAYHRNAPWFGVGIALIELTDDLDGAIARVTGTSSAFGAYLDAVTDRYKELFVFGVLGFTHDAWLLAFACSSGALLTSYNKARAGMEMPVSNVAWPDLFERLERIVTLCIGLVLSAWLPRIAALNVSLVVATLSLIAVLTHVTALQRFVRARRLLTPGPP